MSSKIIYRAFALFLVAFFFSSERLAAQDAPSVADAARQAREQKQASSKPAQVIDNDTLAPAPSAPTTPAKDSVSTSAPAAPENGSAPAADKPAADSKEEGEKKAKIDALKQEIADKQRSVNLQQREIALAQNTYYSNPDHDHDKTGREKLESMQSDLKDQQGQLAELQAKLAELAPQADAKSPEPSKP